MQSQAYRMSTGEALFHHGARKMQYHHQGEQLYRDPHPHQHRHLVHTDGDNNTTLLVHPRPVHRSARHKSLLTHAHDMESDPSSPHATHISGDEVAVAHHSFSPNAVSNPSSQTTPSSLPAHPHPLYKSLSLPSRLSPSYAARKEKEASPPNVSFAALPSPPLQSDAHPGLFSAPPPPPPQPRRTLPSTHFADRPSHFAHRQHRCLCLLPFVETNTPAMGAAMYGTPASNDDGHHGCNDGQHQSHSEKGQHFEQWLDEYVNVEGDVDGHDIVDLEHQASPDRTITAPSTPFSDPPMAVSPSVSGDEQQENHDFNASNNGTGSGYVYTGYMPHHFPDVPQTNVSAWASDGDVFRTTAPANYTAAPAAEANGLNPLAHNFVPDMGYMNSSLPTVYPPIVTTTFSSVPTTYAHAYDQRAVPYTTHMPPPVYQHMQHHYPAPMLPTMQTSQPCHGTISRPIYAGESSGLNPTAAPFFLPNMAPRSITPSPLHLDHGFDYPFNGYMPTLGDGINESTTLQPLHASQRKRLRVDDDDHSVAFQPAKKAKISTEDNDETGAPSSEVTKFDFGEYVNFTPSKDSDVVDASRDGKQEAVATRPEDTSFEPVPVSRPSTPLQSHSPDLHRETVSPKDLQVVADHGVQSSEPVESYNEPGLVHPIPHWHGYSNHFVEDYGHLSVPEMQSFSQPATRQAIGPCYNYPSPHIMSESFVMAGHSHHITHPPHRAPEPNMGDGQPTVRRSSSSTNASANTRTRRQATRRPTTASSSRSRSRYTSDEESEAKRQRDALFVHLKDSGLGYKEIKEQMGLTEADSTLRGRYRTLKKAKKDRVRQPVWSDVDDAVLRSIVTEKTDAHGGPLNFTKISWKLVQEEMGAAGRYRFGYAALKKRAAMLFRNTGNGAPQNDDTDSQATELASLETNQDLTSNEGVGSNVNDPYVV